MKELGVKPHAACKISGSAVDGRTARGKGYALSLKFRKRTEETLGFEVQ